MNGSIMPTRSALLKTQKSPPLLLAVYTALLKSLNLFPPDVAAPPPSHAFPASITIEQPSEATPRFVSPIIPTRLWPISESWNLPGLLAFFTAFNAAKARELHAQKRHDRAECAACSISARRSRC